jgi:hypothetical protein
MFEGAHSKQRPQRCQTSLIEIWIDEAERHAWFVRGHAVDGVFNPFGAASSMRDSRQVARIELEPAMLRWRREAYSFLPLKNNAEVFRCAVNNPLHRDRYTIKRTI